jgi:hypothetical protein
VRWRQVMERFGVLLSSGLLLACATPGAGLPDAGSTVVAELVRVLTREQVAAGDVAPGQQWQALAEALRQQGLLDADVDAGRAIVIRRGLYWFNTTSGIKRGMLQLARLDAGLKVEVGNVIELRLDEQGRSTAQRVRAASLVDGGCHFVELPSTLVADLAGFIGMVGPRGMATLYCGGFEQDGWQRPRQFWVRPPGAGTAPAAAPAPTPLAEHALLLLFRADLGLGSSFAVPFWVDGHKVAELSRRQCETVLLPPGAYVVSAGAGGVATGVKREVSLSVQAGEQVVVEYRIDNTPQTQWGLAELFSAQKREQALQRAYGIALRRATPEDRCAIAHAPRVVEGAAAAAPPPP